MMRIDSHQHFWRIARGDYTWLRADVPALAPLLRDFLPEHLVPVLQANGVKQTVLVQAAASVTETEFLLDLADRHAFVAGVIGWVDLGRSDAARMLEAWARHPRFKGVRQMLQDLPDADWIAHAPHPDAVGALVRLDLRLDALVQPRHLPALLRFARAWPAVPIVIDHAAKPQLPLDDSADTTEAWRRDMAALAALPQVHCKLSGLLTEAAPATGAAAAAMLHPVWNDLLQWFGPARLMWGSDWPVLTLAADYPQWVATSDAWIGALSEREQALVWHGTAQRFYGIP